EAGRVVRIDAVPRDDEGSQRFPAVMRVVLRGAEAEALERARRRGEELDLVRGAEATWPSLPPGFADRVGETFEAKLRVDFRADPWPAEFRVRSKGAEKSVKMQM